MKTPLAIAVVLGALLLGGCGTHRPARASQPGGSPFRPPATVTAPARPGSTLLIRAWSMRCLDPDAPEIEQFLTPSGETDAGEPMSAESAAGLLDALDARALLEIRSCPVLAILGGETGEIRVGTAADGPGGPDGAAPGEIAAPYDLGERFRFGTVIDDGGSISLTVNYRLETIDHRSAHADPAVSLALIDTAVRMQSGQTVVLGGQRLRRAGGPDRERQFSVLLLAVNVSAVESGGPAREGTADHATAPAGR